MAAMRHLGSTVSVIQLGKFLRGIFVAALIVACGSVAFAAKPNVIFILTDDLGHGDVGIFFQNLRKTNNVRSEPWHMTPQLDTMASQGTQLRRHYCPAPVCAPSRASLLLGVHQGHANVRDNQFDKALANNHTLGTVMKQAGYATATFGKWGLQGGGGNPTLWPAYPTKRGFDYYFGYVRHGDGHEHYPKEGGAGGGPKQVWENNNEISSTLDKCYTTDLFTSRTKRWITDHQATNAANPFFIFLAYDTPHAVLELPTQAYPAGGGTNGGLQWLGTPGNAINTASGTIDSYYHPDYASATYDHDNNAGTAEIAWPDVFKRYATSVRRIDDCVGDLVTLLKQLNLDTNTMIVFTSDNGPSKESYLAQAYDPSFFNSFGPHDGIKRDLWEGGVRVGALVRWPGMVLTNQVNFTPSSFADWMPTFSEIAGLTPPARTDGVSLMPLLKGVGTQKSPTVYIEYYEGGTTPNYTEFAAVHRSRTRSQMQVLHIGNHKGIRYNITSYTNNFEIYDTLADPQETNNLALQPAFTALQQQLKDRSLQVRRPDTSAPRPYDSAHVPASTNLSFTNGVLTFATYEGNWPWVPEFSSLTAVSTGRVAGLNLSVKPRETDFGIAFSGFITVPADGDYTFYLTSDSGAHFRIHDATVIDDDFARTGAEVSGSIRLKSGRHPFRLYYRHGSGSQLLTLKYSGPCIEKQLVPLGEFSLVGNPDPRPEAVNDCTRTPQNTALLIPVLSNDSDDGLPSPLQITSVTPAQAGTATISGTQILYTPGTNFLGDDSFTYTMTDGASSSSASVNVSVFFWTNSVWFPLNQTSGLETTEAGGGIAATLTGFPTETDHWVEGRWNRAVNFDGVSQYATIGDGYLPPSGNSARTTSAWIRTTGTGSIIAWGANSTSRKWHMRLENGASFTGALRIEIGGGVARGTRDLRDDQWHHVVGVLPALASPNATNILLYVDGTLEPLTSLTASPITTDSVAATIGVDSQSRYFAGIIDEVRIYNRALSASEITALYNAGNQSAAAWHYRFYGDGPILWSTDDDADRGSRLLEYAFGSQPRIADADRMKIAGALVSDHLEITFPRRLIGTTELNYAAQASTNLMDWNTLTTSEVGTVASDMFGFELATFRADVTVLTHSPLYMRLKLNLP